MGLALEIWGTRVVKSISYVAHSLTFRIEFSDKPYGAMVQLLGRRLVVLAHQGSIPATNKGSFFSRVSGCRDLFMGTCFSKIVRCQRTQKKVQNSKEIKYTFLQY